MTDNVVISEVDIFLYVVLSKGEKSVSYGKGVGNTECITYKGGVAQTKIVVTEFNCILFGDQRSRSEIARPVSLFICHTSHVHITHDSLSSYPGWIA
jgi:hypothetical protein